MILGTFSMRTGPSASSAAGTIATAAFFAPEMVTSPLSVLPPLMTYFVKPTYSSLLRAAAARARSFVTVNLCARAAHGSPAKILTNIFYHNF